MMTPFSTPLKTELSKYKFEPEHTILMMGSCFSVNIGEKLIKAKINTSINPFGISFNPISIAKNISALINETQYQEQDLFFHNERWHSFEHHSEFSSNDKQRILQKIRKEISNGHKILQKSNTLILTLGSAFAYTYKGKVIANCHKVPNSNFTKKLISVSEIIINLNEQIETLKTFNPNLKIIFTVSPVRHIKDGLHENNLSKSTLLLAINELVKKHKHCIYFPAYELIIDELRDYRFFKDDMVHPSNLAVNFVWDKFKIIFFSKKAAALNIQIEKINNALNHKPFNPSSESHLLFLQKISHDINTLEKEYSFLDFKHEKLSIEKTIENSSL